MKNMFYLCEGVTNIYVGSSWSTNKVMNSTNMFYGCSNLPHYNSSKVDKTNANTSSTGYLTDIANKTT